MCMVSSLCATMPQRKTPLWGRPVGLCQEGAHSAILSASWGLRSLHWPRKGLCPLHASVLEERHHRVGGCLASFKPSGMDWTGHLWVEWDAKNVGRKWRNCWFAGVSTIQLSVVLEDVLIDLSTSVYLQWDFRQYAFCLWGDEGVH